MAKVSWESTEKKSGEKGKDPRRTGPYKHEHEHEHEHVFVHALNLSSITSMAISNATTSFYTCCLLYTGRRMVCSTSVRERRSRSEYMPDAVISAPAPGPIRIIGASE